MKDKYSLLIKHQTKVYVELRFNWCWASIWIINDAIL